MTDFDDRDLTGASFERVSLQGANFTQLYLNVAWVGRSIPGNSAPWRQLGLPWDEAPRWSLHRAQRGMGARLYAERELSSLERED